MRSKEEDFLLELTALTQKYKLAIAGCGCCGSPSLDELKDVSPEDGYIHGHSMMDVRWVAKSDKYDWEKYSQFIIKGD